MGYNEFGVVAGNEALFTKRKFSDHGLLGMDLLRLVLEASKSAREAVEVISKYLEIYGQGGSNSRTRTEYYDNLFLVADQSEAYNVQVINKDVQYDRIEEYGSISNYPIFTKNEANNGKEEYKLNRIYRYFGHGKERSIETKTSIRDHEKNFKL